MSSKYSLTAGAIVTKWMNRRVKRWTDVRPETRLTGEQRKLEHFVGGDNQGLSFYFILLIYQQDQSKHNDQH